MLWNIRFKKLLKKQSKPQLFFLLASLVFGVITVFSVPAFWGFDETSHFSKIYLLSDGKFVPSQGSQVPKSLNDASWYAINDIGEEKQLNIFLRNDINNPREYNNLLNEPFSTQKEAAINPAGYSIFAYPLSVVSVAVIKFFDPSIGVAVFIARLASLFTFVFIIYSALAVLNRNKFKKTQWLVVSIALLPTTLFQAATLSADTVVNSLSILFVALLIVILKKQVAKEPVSKLYLIAIFATALLLPLVKVNYALLSIGVLFIKNNLIGGKALGSSCKAIVLVGAVLLSLFMTFGMASAPRSDVPPVSPRPDGQLVDQGSQLHHVINQPFDFAQAVIKSLIHYGDTYIKEMTTVLAWNYVNLPLIFTVICIILLLFAAFYARDELVFFKRYVDILALACIFGILSIFLALYLAFSPVGQPLVDGVQGRYITPFVLPLVISLALAINIQVKAREKTITIILISSIAFVLVGSILYYIKATY